MAESDNEKAITDSGHQADVDVTQIHSRLKMTPVERLRIHESWRLGIRNLKKMLESYVEQILRILTDAEAEYLVIETKRAAGRPKDLAVLPILEELKRIQNDQA